MKFAFSLATDNPDVATILSFARENSFDRAEAYVSSRTGSGAGYPELLTALAASQAEAGRWQEARENCKRAAALDPQNPNRHAHLGFLHFAVRDYGRARQALERAIGLGREKETDYSVLCLSCLRSRDFAAAAKYGERLVQAWPSGARNVKLYAEVLRLSGVSDAPHIALLTAATACLIAGQPTPALQLLQKARELAPDDGGTWSLLAVAHRDCGCYQEAEQCMEQALQLGKGCWRTYNSLGLILQETCRPSAALEAFRNAVEREPSNPIPLGNAAMSMHYIAGIPPDRIRTEIDHYARAAMQGVTAPVPSPARKPGKPLRVGLLSGSFHRHPALYLSLSGLEAMDREVIELFAYANGGRRDDFTGRLQGACSAWRDIRSASDDAVAERMRADGLDILIDMAGSNQGRPGVMARKPAPVQIKWVGGLYNTTGMTCIDWLLADAAQLPEADEYLYSENIYRLPDGYVVYDPPDYAPEVGEAPGLANQHVTFCSFNNPAKINAEIVGVWASIFNQLSDSRLILKGSGFTSLAARRLVHGWFESHGIERHRILMEPAVPHRELLDTYNRSDIALDTWPYSGGLTTCEALWMGNPVVTLPGPTFAGRHSTSHLTNIGRTEWIANSRDDYIAKAVALARNLPALDEIRRSLRHEVAVSPLCDAVAFGQNLQTALLDLAARR